MTKYYIRSEPGKEFICEAWCPEHAIARYWRWKLKQPITDTTWVRGLSGHYWIHEGDRDQAVNVSAISSFKLVGPIVKSFIAIGLELKFGVDYSETFVEAGNA